MDLHYALAEWLRVFTEVAAARRRYGKLCTLPVRKGKTLGEEGETEVNKEKSSGGSREASSDPVLCAQTRANNPSEAGKHRGICPEGCGRASRRCLACRCLARVAALEDRLLGEYDMAEDKGRAKKDY